MGRKPYSPTEADRKQVEAMAACGIRQEDISKVLGIDRKTLGKYYRKELDTGATQANAQVAQSLYRKAVSNEKGSVAAAIFWMKTRAGWREVERKEITGANGGPVTVKEVTQVTKDMTPEEAAEAYERAIRD